MVVTTPPGPFDATWDSLIRYQVPEWYLDAKFGIFIHWGVYSVPAFANEWYPRNMYRQGEKEFEHHKATYGDHKDFGYKDFIPMFAAAKFNADEWAQLFRDAGAKFVVPVAEHHDGFAMYKTKFSKWNAVEMGPKRDVIGELAASMRNNGLVFGVSSHRAEHWWFMNGGKEFASDVSDPGFEDFYGPAQSEKAQPDEIYLDDWLARCAELIDTYKPQLFWFDWWIEQPAFAPYLRRFAAYYYNRAHAWGQGVAINYKNEAFPVGAAVFDVERGGLAGIRPQFWQTDTAVATNSWSNVQGLEYRTSASLVHDLIDIVSKNGCLLLNIGPRSDGTIPAEDQSILRDIGRWLGLCGEAIYGTRAYSVFGEGPTEMVEGAFKDTERPDYGPKDFRFTRKDSVVYATCLSGEPSSMDIVSLGTSLSIEPREVASVSWVGSATPLQWKRTEAALEVNFESIPKELQGLPALAIRVEFQEKSS